MDRTNKDGGRPADINVNAKPGEVPRNAFITYPSKKGSKTFKAKNINDFLAEVSQSFKVNLRQAEGKTSNEKIDVQTFEDIGLDKISQNSPTLSKLKMQKDFLEKFLAEWRGNPNFRAELRDLMSEENRNRKDNMLKKLKALQSAIQQPESQLEYFLKSLNLPYGG